MTRISTMKTYKAYINGQFARSESGRHYSVASTQYPEGINVPLCSRKDVRNAVVGARKAQSGWAGKTAFNRSQILYRIAEMLEGRMHQFVATLVDSGASESQAKLEVEMAIDRCIYYAGWCDKFQVLAGSVNPVSSGHFNFSVPEPLGVAGIACSEASPLLETLSLILPAIAGGNTVVVLTNEKKSQIALELGEVLHTSDVPGGVVQMLSGKHSELLDPLSNHMDLNALILKNSDNEELLQSAEENCSLNLKPVLRYEHDFTDLKAQGQQFIMDVQSMKTTWHPIEVSLGSSASY